MSDTEQINAYEMIGEIPRSGSGFGLAVYGVSIGDYVFASKFSDGDPNDPWVVDFVTEIIVDSDGIAISVGNSNRKYRHFAKITKEQGDYILHSFKEYK